MCASGAPREFRELHAEADIASLADAHGRVPLLGFGSLLSERSARSTFSEVVDFRAARLHGFRRVFCHAAPIFFERGIARPETKEFSSLSVEPSEAHSIVVSIFSIPISAVPLFVEREHEFRFLEVSPGSLSPLPTPLSSPEPGEPNTHSPTLPSSAVICSRYSDEEYRTLRLKGDAAEYFQRYGRWGIDKIWDDSLLPCRIYLRHCVLASKNLGKDAYESFLHQTFLADRLTTVDEYLRKNPSVMEELPPPALADRYGG